VAERRGSIVADGHGTWWSKEEIADLDAEIESATERRRRLDWLAGNRPAIDPRLA
jgi:hypothetical protein